VPGLGEIFASPVVFDLNAFIFPTLVAALCFLKYKMRVGSCGCLILLALIFCLEHFNLLVGMVDGVSEDAGGP